MGVLVLFWYCFILIFVFIIFFIITLTAFHCQQLIALFGFLITTTGTIFRVVRPGGPRVELLKRIASITTTTIITTYRLTDSKPCIKGPRKERRQLDVPIEQAVGAHRVVELQGHLHWFDANGSSAEGVAVFGAVFIYDAGDAQFYLHWATAWWRIIIGVFIIRF